MDPIRTVLKMRRPMDRRPDFSRFARAVTTHEAGPVPIGDIFADMETVGNLLKQPVFDYANMAADPQHRVSWQDLKDAVRYVDQSIQFCLLTGWDYAYSFSSIPFKGFSFQLADNTAPEMQDRKRYWIDDKQGPIQSWDDFEQYPWPTNVGAINLMSKLMAKRVPDGMKVMVIPGGVFEWTTWLMGLVPFCYALTDQPDLVDAVIERVAACIGAVVEDLMEQDGIGGVFMGDDLGYASGTIISPEVLRARFLPQTKRIVDLVKRSGKIFVLHTCGDTYAVMDDLIEMGIDAKHSFEDKILPVEDAYQRWASRVAIIGGVDMHLLASGTEDQVRQRTRQILDICGPGGRYVLGTGNSVANYVPLRNYLAMVDEGHRWNKARFGREY